MTILTKTIVPVRRRGLVRRQRLLDVLYQGLDCKLTLVTAAAGYGKTSLLTEFAHDVELPVCWLTLDEEDGDPAQFLTALVAGIAQRFSGFGERTRAALQSGTPLEQVVGVLINELVSEVRDVFVLILDDYHLADTSSMVPVMERLLRFLPGHVRLILSGRTLPSVDLINLTAKQEIAVLVPNELCFTPSETVALLEQNHNLPLQVTDAEMLTRKMKGWITGIILATQQMTRHLVSEPQPTDRSLEVVYAYLAREVLALQLPHVRDFLLQTAILRWMTPEICDAILFRDDAYRTFRMLEARHLFIERIGEGGGVRYRYHPLFREFLLEQLDAWDPGRRANLHRQAARFYSQAGDREEAIRHWLLLGALEEATPLIDALSSEMFTSGRHATLMDWYEQIGDWRESAPRLQLRVAKVLTDQGNYSQALEILNRLLAHPGGVRVLPEIQIQRGYIWYRQGQLQEAIELLYSLAEKESGDQIEASALRVIGLCLHQQSKPHQAQESLFRALEIYRELNDEFNQSQVLLGLVQALTPLGEIDQALHYQGQALQILRRLGNLGSLAVALNNTACLYHSVGRFEEANLLFQEALESAQRSGQLRSEALINIGWADLFRDVGSLPDALNLYQQAITLLESTNETWLQDYARIGMASASRMMGNLVQAQACIEQTSSSTDTSLKTRRLVERGAILVAQGSVESGITLLRQGRDAWMAQRIFSELAVAELYLGSAFLGIDANAAASALERALAASSQCTERDIRLVMEARHFPALLALGDRRSINPPVLDRIRTRVHELNQLCAQFARHYAQATAPATLQIFAFGDGRVIKDGREIAASDWRRSTARHLFFYIADRKQVRRSDLLGQFWPEAPENKAISRLHTAVYDARRAVGSDWLLYLPDEGSYLVNMPEGIWSDVVEFEKALTQARRLAPGRERAAWLHQAVDLYSGPYLADIEEEWVMERRRNLESAYREALTDLGDCFYADQDYEQARVWYLCSLEIDSYQEDVHRRLILSLVNGGRRAEALRQYEKCTQILRDELGIDPDPLTQALIEQIKGP